MAKYEVTRSFPDYRRGQIIEVADWKNREKLVRTGYLREIVEDRAVEMPPETEIETASEVPPVKKRGRKKK